MKCSSRGKTTLCARACNSRAPPLSTDFFPAAPRSGVMLYFANFRYFVRDHSIFRADEIADVVFVDVRNLS